jgi:hypothetical protein
MAFFEKANAKVRTIFITTKLFRRNFQKKFFEWFGRPNFAFSISITAASLSIADAKVEVFPIPTKHTKHFFTKNLHPFT